MFSGVISALPTFFKNGQLDLESLGVHMGLQREAGIDGFVACGTTGESPTLSHEEWARVVSFVAMNANGLPVIAGTGSNNTAHTIQKSREAAELGAHALLVVVPYYNKPTQEGMLAHFTSVADNSSLPLVLYNIPGRSAVNMSPQTVATLSAHPMIKAIKEASGNLDQVSETALLTRSSDFSILSGDDTLTLPILSVGGKGVISTNSNILPRQMKKIVSSFGAGRIQEAWEEHLNIFALSKALFIESNPAPLKYALSLTGVGSAEVRLPLVPLGQKHRPVLTEAMKELGLI